MSAVGSHALSMADLAGRDLGSHTASYTAAEAILYSIAVGAKADELELVYERDLRPLPMMAWVLALWGVEAAGRTGAYDPLRTLHVGQTLEMHRPLPRDAEVEMEARISAVYDKGSAALLEVTTSSEYFDTSATIFIPGGGGFGGDRGPSSAADPDSEPELEISVDTWPEQAVLYRLTGDLHPLHVDPAVAAEAGFDRPILHGLCTLGSMVLALGRAAEANPNALTSASGRLAAPVYPGQTLTVEAWRAGDQNLFEGRVGDTKVVKGGAAVFG